MFSILGTFSTVVATVGVLMLSATSAQAQAKSSVRIPLKKEAKPAANVVVVHDTVTMVRVDTVRVVETVMHTDTIFRVDTLRDSCSSGFLPIPIPIPLGNDHRHEATPGGAPLSVTPEPETFVLVGSGLAGLLALSYYRRRK